MSQQRLDAPQCLHGMPTPASCTECMYDGVGVEPEREAPPFPVTTLYARFDGHCRGCDFPVYENQLIHKLSNDTYVHVGCE